LRRLRLCGQDVKRSDFGHPYTTNSDPRSRPTNPLTAIPPEHRSSFRRSSRVIGYRKGGARGYSSVAIRKAFRRAGLHDCTIHTLRHTHATRLIQNGLSVYEVREVLGHADIKTTMRYAHLEKATVLKKARDVIQQLSAG